jgi:succinate dehydrogenase / fumarate reductase iron-sulfur subunit
MSTHPPQQQSEESAAEQSTEPAATESEHDHEHDHTAGPRRDVGDRTDETEHKPDGTDDTREIRVFRYDPEVEDKQEPRFDTFHVPFTKGMTVLDAVIYARDQFDPSLTFRHSCRQAVCGSDAFFVNGQQRLGCKTQLSELEEPIRIEPLPHQDVVKDLVVDMDHFYEEMEAVDPYFDPDETPDGELEEQRQSRANREKVKMSTRCIWCGACFSSCNIAAGDNEYLGPAALNKAYRFAMD